MSCFSSSEKGSLYVKGGEQVNPKEIGAFLKQLRNEKGITQEQLAEILGVSGRTVSRWETGTNLPDLSILVQISEYYHVEIKEILNGERKSENMDHELKETLLKVADYNELEKKRAARAGALSFNIMFLGCALVIVVQLLMTGKFSLIIGETLILSAGGLIYIFCVVKDGAWNGALIKSTPKKDLLTSLICVGIFSIVLCLMLKKNMAVLQAIEMAACFFVALSIISYFFLRGLSCLSQKKSEKLKD
jgi:transcriptional regulator with XRE-family HTH domain